jgi:hypothetical protein
VAQLLQLGATRHPPPTTAAGCRGVWCSPCSSTALAFACSCCVQALCMRAIASGVCVTGPGGRCAGGAEGGRQGNILAGQLVALRGERLHLQPGRHTAGTVAPGQSTF